MKYIENIELREWVKDNLKKTIFQKAHALAVQTGCQILVKLQDDLDLTQHQYYATDRLRKVFKNAGLRPQPEEKFVSGVTGEPLIDQAIQSDSSEHVGLQTSSVETSTDSDKRLLGGDSRVGGQEDDMVKTEEEINNEETTIMHLAMTCESSEDTGQDSMQTEYDRPPAEETGEPEEEDGDVVPRVKIKLEQMDDDQPGADGDGTTSMYQEQDLDSNTPTSQSEHQLDSLQFQGAVASPSTSQYSSPMSSYQVPMSPKPYQCAMCGKAFRSVQVLQKHTHTFHMKTQHVMGARTSRGRGRGRPSPSGPRFLQLGGHGGVRPAAQPQSYTCVMCNIAFPELDILHDHMSRTHMAAASSTPPHTEGTPDNASFSAPSTSQVQQAFPSPSSDAPAAQGSPYSQQPGTSSSVPVFPRPASSPSGSRSNTSPGTARMGLGKFRSRIQHPGPNSPITISNIMRAILLTTGPVNNCSAFLHSGPTHMRQAVTVEKYNKAALQLQEAGMGEFVKMEVGGYLREVFVKKLPKDVENILVQNPQLCDPLVYALRYYMPLPSKFRTKMRQKLVELGYVTEDQVFRACRL